MPATKKRIRPVIEEVIETAPVPHEAHHSHTHKQIRVEEEVPLETQQEVAHYDEPPLLERAPDVSNVEAAARDLLGKDDKPNKPNLKILFIVTVLTALVVGFIAGGVYVYVSGVTDSRIPEVSPTPEPQEKEVVPTQKPSPSPTVVPSSYTVSVLNGSGVIGAASKVRATLEEAGFKITGTGNAASYNFKTTTIQTKPTVPKEALELVKKSLSEYVVEVGEALSGSSTFDIIVTAGKQ